MPKWNPYPTREAGWVAKVWFRPDGSPRSKLKGAVFVTLSTFTILMCSTGLDLIADYERVAFLLAYLVLAQQVDKTYSLHDFESLDSTKEYFYKLCRALPHDEDAEEDAEGTIQQFIELMETTINMAGKPQVESPSLPSPPDSLEPNDPVSGGYLSHLKSDDPSLEALFRSPNPDPLQAVHAIMRAYAQNMHELLERDLKKQTLLVCAQAALVGFKITVSALGAVSEKVGAVESQDAFGRSILERSGKGEGGESKEKDDYESIG